MSFMSCVWIQWVYAVSASLSHCYTVNLCRNKTGKQLLNTFTVYVLYKCLLNTLFEPISWFSWFNQSTNVRIK